MKNYCPHAYDVLKVQENGAILSCCLPYSKNMGDLHKTSLEDIIGSKEFEDNRVNCTCSMRRMLENRKDYAYTSEVSK